jgi:hypothetical protein
MKKLQHDGDDMALPPDLCSSNDDIALCFAVKMTQVLMDNINYTETIERIRTQIWVDYGHGDAAIVPLHFMIVTPERMDKDYATTE